MKNTEITTLDIELALMLYFDFRRNIMVPRVQNSYKFIRFETDMILLSKNRYATGFEIKISKSDLKNDLHKKHISGLNSSLKKSCLSKYYSYYKYFNYIVPDFLKDDAMKQIPEEFGLYIFEKSNTKVQRCAAGSRIKECGISCVRKPQILFNKQWNVKEQETLTRLGCLKIFNLERKINELNEKIQ